MTQAETHPFRSNANRKAFRWSEVPPETRLLRRLVNSENSYLRCYKLGECSVIVTKEFGRWHLSIAHPSRYPNWDEIAESRYRAVPDEAWMALALPPRDVYVNLHPNCFQLIQISPPEGPKEDRS